MGLTAWFHCFCGIAGDMAMGALVDAGADLDEIRELCEQLPVTGWRLEAEAVLRGGVAATKIHVEVEETTVVRTAGHIAGLIEEARLPQGMRDRALAIFSALAEVEGKLHRRPPSQVHFHEVGSLDAIIDVLGTCAALEVLGVADIRSSAVATGHGMHHSSHGYLPSPAPAVVGLLTGAPTYGIDLGFELTTPTGAAILAGTVGEWGPLPALTIEASGFGAGSRELDDRPNVTQVILGQASAAHDSGQPVVLLEANVDDVTGEVLAEAITALIEAGAHDAWISPIVMKKGRPAHTVSALTDPSLTAQVARVLTESTGSLGVRGHQLERWPRSRVLDEVEVAGLSVRVKVGPGRVKVEHDDAARAARTTGLPLREVVSLAEEAYRRRGGPNPDADPDDDPPPVAG